VYQLDIKGTFREKQGEDSEIEECEEIDDKKLCDDKEQMMLIPAMETCVQPVENLDKM
jgi:hypothetical protein